MNSTKIEWCERTWNPVTGCFHRCEYCYAADIARRFGGAEGGAKVRWIGNCVELDKPLYRMMTNGQRVYAPFPFGFFPTFHRYRLEEPQQEQKARNVFVGSMTDLFGSWVPFRWIRDVLDACLAAPWHRYLFLTKNQDQYRHLNHMAFLPLHNFGPPDPELLLEADFWFGITVTDQKSAENSYRALLDGFHYLHIFWSVEPLHGPINMTSVYWDRTPEWVIIGAETGKRKDKIIPRREWVDNIASFCIRLGIPVFYKSSIRKLFPDLPPSQFPW